MRRGSCRGRKLMAGGKRWVTVHEEPIKREFGAGSGALKEQQWLYECWWGDSDSSTAHMGGDTDCRGRGLAW